MRRRIKHNGTCCINGQTASWKDFVHSGDIVTVELPLKNSFTPEKMELPIAYEDEYLLAVNKPAGLLMLLLIFSLLLCIALFRLFIFGGFGIPAMGGIGTGYAIAVSAWITLFLFLFVFLTQEPFRSYRLFRTLRPAAFIYWSEILRLGVPMAIAIFCETSLFSIVGLFMGQTAWQAPQWVQRSASTAMPKAASLLNRP